VDVEADAVVVAEVAAVVAAADEAAVDRQDRPTTRTAPRARLVSECA
jgi:hypothetical protein